MKIFWSQKLIANLLGILLVIGIVLLVATFFRSSPYAERQDIVENQIEPELEKVNYIKRTNIVLKDIYSFL